MWLQPWNLRKQTMEEATVLWSTNQGYLCLLFYTFLQIVITLEIYVEKSANGWASLMVRATELSLPAKRKPPPLVSICAKQVERVTKVAQIQEIIKSQVVIRFFFFFYSCDLCDLMIHPAGLREKLSSDM
ncbi:unnamed protein product [Brassica oleracea]